MSQSRNMAIAATISAMALFASVVSAAEPSPDSLKALAKVTESDARAKALAKVPGGTVESVELEREHGKLIWSFDVRDPRSPNIIEIQIDAKNGRIVSKKSETPAEQAREAKADKPQKP